MTPHRKRRCSLAFRESTSAGVKVRGSDRHLSGVRVALERRGVSPATIGCVNRATEKDDAAAFDANTERMRQEALARRGK